MTMYTFVYVRKKGASRVAQLVKKSAYNAGDPRSILQSGSFPGEGIGYPPQYSWVSLVAQRITCNVGDMGLIPGLGRSPGGGHGSPLKYSCLENPMKRGTQKRGVHRAAKSWTRQKQLSTHTRMYMSQLFFNYLRRIGISSSFYVWYKSPKKLLFLNFNFLGVFLKLQIQFYY